MAMKANIIKPIERLKIPKFDISKVVNDEYHNEILVEDDSTSHDTHVKKENYND